MVLEAGLTPTGGALRPVLVMKSVRRGLLANSCMRRLRYFDRLSLLLSLDD